MKEEERRRERRDRKREDKEISWISTNLLQINFLLCIIRQNKGKIDFI